MGDIKHALGHEDKMSRVLLCIVLRSSKAETSPGLSANPNASLICSSSPKLNSSAMLILTQTVCLLPVGILNHNIFVI